MKDLFAKLVTLMLLSHVVLAQQRPHYSQYIQNISVINPAATGQYQGMDFRMGLRTQWLGLESAPKTGYFTFSTPFSLGGDLAYYRGADLGVTDPTSNDDVADYVSSRSHHAVGALVLMDKTDPLNRIIFNATYAYHLELGSVANLAVGMGVGFNRLSLDAKSLVFEESDDPVVGTSAEINRFTPDLNFGVYFYGANFYIGAAMQQVVKNKLNFASGFATGKDVAHYFISGAYKFWMSNDFWLSPSLMIKMVKPLPTAFDMSFMSGYQDLAWLSVGYRKNDALFVGAGCRIATMVDLGYNYDFTRSKLRSFTSGSHEITLRYLLKP